MTKEDADSMNTLFEEIRESLKGYCGTDNKQNELKRMESELKEMFKDVPGATVSVGGTPTYLLHQLPAIGQEVEIRFRNDSPLQEWYKFKLVAIHEEIAIVELDGEPTWRHISHFTPSRVLFRSIHSEVERRREKSIKAIMEVVSEGNRISQNLYNAIAAGKIPGIKLINE